MATVSFVLLLVVTSSMTTNGLRADTCALSGRKYVIEPDAAAVIGGVVSLRLPGADGYGCGEPFVPGMQAVEAMRWTLERLNQDSGEVGGLNVSDSYVPGVKIGLQMADACFTSEGAISSAIDIFPELLSAQTACQDDRSKLSLGIIGDFLSSTSASLAEFLGNFEVPQVSYGASAPSLSDSDTYPYFLRTVAPDTRQAEVIVSVLEAIQWHSFVIVHSADTFGMEGASSLLAVSKLRSLCPADVIEVQASSHSEELFDKAIARALRARVQGAVYLGTEDGAMSLMAAMGRVPNAGQLQWFLAGGDFNSLASAEYLFARGALGVTSSVRAIPEFRDHWLSLDENNPPPGNPVFREWYVAKHGCKLPGMTGSDVEGLPDCVPLSDEDQLRDFSQHAFTEPAILAVYAYAKALKNAHRRLCGGTPGVCRALSDLTSEEFFRSFLSMLDFTFSREDRLASLASADVGSAERLRFDGSGDLADAGYDIWNIYGTEGDVRKSEVGNYTNGQLNIRLDAINMYDPDRTQARNVYVPSPCPGDTCQGCLWRLPGPRPPVFAFIPGDVVIGASFPVHGRGGGGLFTCGDIDSLDGAVMAQAFFYGLELIREAGILPDDVTLGGLALDDCASPEVARVALAQLDQGALLRRGDKAPDVGDVHAFIGGHSDDVTTALSQVLGQLDIPLLSPRSRGPVGGDREGVSPALYAGVLPDERKAIRAATLLLKRMAWDYVQVVAPAHAQQASLETLTDETRKQDICIAVTHRVGGEDDDVVKNLASNLNMNSDAKVVILLGDKWFYQPIIQSLTTGSETGDFTYIIINGDANGVTLAENATSTLISLQIPIREVESFEEFIGVLDPSTYADNPWFVQWYEDIAQCSIKSPHSGNTYPDHCPQGISIIELPGFIGNTAVVEVLNAMFATAYGLDSTLSDFCGSGYDSVCTQYLHAENRSQVLMDNILKVSFNDVTGSPFSFSENSGNDVINVIVKHQGQEQEVGEYRPAEDALTLAFDSLKDVATSRCSGGACPECLYLDSPEIPGDNLAFQDGDFILGALVNIHNSVPGSPLHCGGLRDGGAAAQLVEAFNMAVGMVNDGSGPVALRGVHLGGVVMDACSSGTRASGLAVATHTGLPDLKEMIEYPKGTVDGLLSWITDGSDVTNGIADAVSSLGRVQISLSMDKFPGEEDGFSLSQFSFVPSNEALVQAMVGLLSSEGWKTIQAVFGSGKGDKAIMQLVEEKTKENGICVLDSYQYGVDGRADDILQKLLTSPTDVVLVFLPLEDSKELLKATTTSADSPDRLVLIMADIFSTTPFGLLTSPGGDGPATVITVRGNDTAADFLEGYIDDLAPEDKLASDPWFGDYYEYLWQCNLKNNFDYSISCNNFIGRSITESALYTQDSKPMKMVRAVFAVTHALNSILREYCGDDYEGVCDGLPSNDYVRSLIATKLRTLSFIDMDGQSFSLGTSGQYRQTLTFNIMNEDGSSEMVGSFDGASLLSRLDSMDFDTVTTGCGTLCARCQTEAQEVKVTFTPGDVLLGGVFDVHQAGPDGLSCGALNPNHGFQLVEAFNFAIDYVNKKRGVFSGRLAGVTLGGIALDTCQSPLRTATLLARLHSGDLALGDTVQDLRVDDIHAYIGGFDSATSRQMAEVVNRLRLPQVSYGSSSSLFGDRSQYPMFLTTAPSDKQTTRAMLTFLQRYDLEYVQVLHSAGSYGQFAAQAFVDAARDSRKTCVAQNISFGDRYASEVSPEEADAAVATLLQNPDASVVILFLDRQDIPAFIEALDRKQQDIQDAGLQFVASETWGNDVTLLRNAGASVANLVTWSVVTSNSHDFDEYLDGITPDSSTSGSNPWFRDYYQYIYQCSLEDNTCPNNRESIPRSPNYFQDSYIQYTINAVFATALGLDQALREGCPQATSGLCSAFRNAPNRSRLLYEAIQNAEFQDISRQTFKFTDERSGDRGFQLHNVEGTPGGLYYSSIGSFDANQKLTISSGFEPGWESSCAEGCAECLQYQQITKSRAANMATGNDLNILSFFPVHRRSSQNPFQCGDVDMDGGFHDMLAFFYAIDALNSGVLNLPSDVTVGGSVVDTCGSHYRVTEQVYETLKGDATCSAQSDLTAENLIGLLGTSPSDVRSLVDVTGDVPVTVVSLGGSSSELRGATNLLSTSLTSADEGRVLADVANRMQWAFVAVIYSDDEEGREAVEAFYEAASGSAGNSGSSVCVGKKVKLTSDASLAFVKDVMEQIRRVDGVRAIILLTSQGHTRLALSAVKDSGLVGRFTFLGGTRWPRDVSSSALAEVARGALSLQEYSDNLPGFAGYIRGLTVASHEPIPDDWFEEFWQRSLRCRLDNATTILTQFTQVCSSQGRLAPDFTQDPGRLHTIIAAQSLALGVASVAECVNSPLGVATCINRLPNKAGAIYRSTKGITWRSPVGLSGKDINFRFTEDGLGSLGYELVNLRKDGSYPMVGYYVDGSLTLELTLYRTYDSRGESRTNPLQSQCPIGRTCVCDGVSGGGGSGGRPTGGSGGANALPAVDLHTYFHQPWGVVLAVFSGVGILITLVLFVYLLVSYPDRGGSSVLGYLLLFGVILVYAVNFAFILQAGEAICGIRIFCQGYVYALCFSCMLLKCITNWQLMPDDSESEYQVRQVPVYSRAMHPACLFFTALGLSIVQAGLMVEWILLVPPKVDWVTLADDSGVLARCAESAFHNQELVISCVYVMLLMVLTFVFACVTWNCDENSRESRWILASVCFTVIIWVLWGILSTLLKLEYRDPAIAIANLVNASVFLACIYFRKLYLMNKYQKEERQAVSHYSHTYIESDPQGKDGFAPVFVNRAYDGATYNGTVGSHRAYDGATYNGTVGSHKTVISTGGDDNVYYNTTGTMVMKEADILM